MAQLHNEWQKPNSSFWLKRWTEKFRKLFVDKLCRVFVRSIACCAWVWNWTFKCTELKALWTLSDSNFFKQKHDYKPFLKLFSFLFFKILSSIDALILNFRSHFVWSMKMDFWLKTEFHCFCKKFWALTHLFWTSEVTLFDPWKRTFDWKLILTVLSKIIEHLCVKLWIFYDRNLKRWQSLFVKNWFSLFWKRTLGERQMRATLTFKMLCCWTL